MKIKAKDQAHSIFKENFKARLILRSYDVCSPNKTLKTVQAVAT
jgi:hypothetical protein